MELGSVPSPVMKALLMQGHAVLSFYTNYKNPMCLQSVRQCQFKDVNKAELGHRYLYKLYSSLLDTRQDERPVPVFCSRRNSEHWEPDSFGFNL